MRVDAKLPIGTTGVAPRRQAGGRFTVDTPAASSAGPAAGASATGALGTIESLLVLQGEEDPAQRRRRQAKRGGDILDSLDRLKAALLSGRIPMVDLLRLRALLGERRDATDDPRLDEVLAHIELRAAVELAKLGR
ncbi:flagellar assembly protein FliX [Alsobacter sp. R-9]